MVAAVRPLPTVLLQKFVAMLQHLTSGHQSGHSTSNLKAPTLRAGTSNATLALLELAPADGLRERFEGFVYMDVQMLTVCDGIERSGVRLW